MPVRTTLVVALLAGLLLPPAAPAAAQEGARPRALVLWLDGTTLDDWTSGDLPAFRALLDQGTVATMTAATSYEGTDPVQAALAAAETLGAGRITPGAPTDDQRRTPFALTLATFGVPTQLLSGAPEPIPPTAERAFGPIGVLGGSRFARRDRAFPGEARTDPDRIIRALGADARDARLVVVHVPDALLAERTVDEGARDEWAALTMRRADRILAAMREQAGDEDLVMVVSPTPPRARRGDGAPLTAIVVARGGVDAGLLRSETTRRDGLVSLSDVAPTILAALGISAEGIERIVLPRFLDTPLPFQGHAMEVTTRADALAKVRALEDDLLDAASAHRASARLFTLAAIGVLLLGLLTVIAGRGTTPGSGSLPRGWRDALAAAAMAVIAFPAASLIAGAEMWVTVVVAVAAALIARAFAGRERGAAILVLASVALIAVDALAGGSLAARAALPEPVAFGRSLLPLGPVTIGVLLAGLPAAGAWIDRDRPGERAALGLVAAGGLAVFLAGSAGAGADGGAAAALIPALLLLAFAVAGRSWDLVSSTAIVAVTIAGLGALALTYGPAIWVEEAPLIPQRGIPSGVAARWDAFVDVLPSVWLAGLVVTGGSLLALRMRRPMLTDRGWWGRPYLRAGALAAVLGAGIGLITIRAGIIAAATVVSITSLLLLLPLLAPDEQG